MTKIQAIGIKDDNLPFRIVNRALLEQELNGLPRGRYRLAVAPMRKDKSNPQLGYLFSCVYPLALKFLNEAGWEFTEIEEVDAFFKDLYASRDIVNRNTGEIMSIPALKRNFSTVDMMTYVDAVRNYCAEYLGGYIPDPETNLEIEYK